MAFKKNYELDYTPDEQKCPGKLIDEGKIELMVFTVGKLYCQKGERLLQITVRMGLPEATVKTLLKFYIEVFPFLEPGEHINFPARRAIEFLQGLGCSNQATGHFIGKSGVAVGKEIKRNADGSGNYNAKEAQKRRGGRKHGSTSLKGRDPKKQRFLKHVESELKEKKHSPCATAEQARPGKGKVRFGKEEIVSKSALCGWIRAGECGGIKVEDMPQMKPETEPEEITFGKVSDKIDENQSIENMPPIPENALGEKEFGHWQFDLVEGVKGGKVLLTMTETKTRFLVAGKLDSKSAGEVGRALKEIIDGFGEFAPKVFKSFLTDNGSEFLKISEVNPRFLPDLVYLVFYCHVGVPEEKGAIERQNREIRKYIKKGMDIGNLTESEIKEIVDNVNSLARRVLGFETAADMFAWELNIVRAGIDLSK